MWWAVPGVSASIDWGGLPIYKGEALGTRLKWEWKQRLNLVPSLRSRPTADREERRLDTTLRPYAPAQSRFHSPQAL